VSYFVIRAAETWTWGSIGGAVLLLILVVGIASLAFFVTRDR
jgi:hypothetical protein